MTASGGRLHGVGVLVTRPEPAAGRLADAFEAEGAVVVRVPAIEIVPPEDPASLERLRGRVRDAAAAVFTSAHAVEGFCDRGPDGGCPALPPVVLAVGPSSAEALRARRVAGVDTPRRRFDSEGLLACPQLEAHRVRGRRVVIVKGEGGRGLLAGELRRRGAEVVEVNVYRRRAPERLAHGLDRVRDSVAVVTVTSVEVLENLLGAAPWTAAWLSRPRLVAASARVADVARARGLDRVAVAGGPDAASMVEATVRAVAEPRCGAVGAEVRKVVEIVNNLGLHARAAAKLVDLASGFESGIRIRRDGREADAKSIMRVMMLAASKGTRIEVVARGADAAEAVEAVERLVAARFDEQE